MKLRFHPGTPSLAFSGRDKKMQDIHVLGGFGSVS